MARAAVVVEHSVQVEGGRDETGRGVVSDCTQLVDEELGSDLGSDVVRQDHWHVGTSGEGGVGGSTGHLGGKARAEYHPAGRGVRVVSTERDVRARGSDEWRTFAPLPAAASEGAFAGGV